MGIEPTLSAWEAEVLPLNYTRLIEYLPRHPNGWFHSLSTALPDKSKSIRPEIRAHNDHFEVRFSVQIPVDDRLR